MAIMLNIAEGLTNLASSLTDTALSSLASFQGLPTRQVSPSAKGWGIYTESGSLLIDFSTFIRFDIDSTNQATQAAVEAGGFVMYNKVVTPTIIDVQAAYSTTDDAELQQVTQALLDLSCSTDLINIVTPSMEYRGYNLESVKYTVDMQKMIVFDLSFIEVKQVTAQYSNAKIATKKQTGKKNGNESALHGLMDMF